MYTVEIANNQSALDIDEDFLREVVCTTLKNEEVAAAEISLALVDNATLRDLNKRYLDHDYDTDVLSFLLDCEQKTTAAPDQPGEGPRGRGKRIDGEVIVSAEMAAQTAADCGWSGRDEVVLYLVHGLLHLMGYDDRSETETELMRSRERGILRFWNLSPGGDC